VKLLVARFTPLLRILILVISILGKAAEKRASSQTLQNESCEDKIFLEFHMMHDHLIFQSNHCQTS